MPADQDRGKLEEILRVYVIADRAAAGCPGVIDAARGAVAGGATCIQYRAKNTPIRTMLREGQKLREAAGEKSVPFIVNDRVDVAAALGADGVHLGSDDMPVRTARRLLGPDRIIGATARSAREGRRLIAAGADYLGVGPVFPSGTKPDAGPVLLPAGLKKIVQTIHAPVVGIGGIEPENAGAVMRAGADGVAVVSCIMAADNPGRAAGSLKKVVEGYIT